MVLACLAVGVFSQTALSMRYGTWVEENKVHPALARDYFQRLGAEGLDAASARKRQRVLARKGWLQVVQAAMDSVKDEWETTSEEKEIAA